MTYQERDFIKQVIEEIEREGKLHSKTVLAVLRILLQDLWDRSLE